MKKIAISLTLLISIFSGTAAFANMAVWCAGDSEKIHPYDSPEEKNFFWDSDTKIVRLFAAKNEYVAFQIVVKAVGQGLSNVNVVANDLSSGVHLIGKDNIDLFREHYLKVMVPSSTDGVPFEDTGIGEYPTQMIPFNTPHFARIKGAPFPVEAGRNQPVWVDLYVPEDTSPGEYEAVFTVTAPDQEPVNIRVLLTVWDFMLPHQTHFRTYIYYGSEQLRWAFEYKNSSDPFFRMLEGKFFQMARQHRLNLCPNIEMKCDYDEFDKYWYERGRGPYIDGSAYTKRVGKGVPANTWVVEIDDFDHKGGFQTLVNRVVDYFSSKGLGDILMLYVFDEPSLKNYDYIKERCEWTHEAVGKKLPCMVTVPIRYNKRFSLDPRKIFTNSLVGYVDIWCSGESSWEDMQKQMKTGDKIWTYNAGWGPGPYVDTPGIAGRTQGWIGWKFGFDGWYFWNSCYWIDTVNSRDANGKRVPGGEINSDPEKYSTKVWEEPLTFDQMKRPGYLPQDAIRINGDGVLFYPGLQVGLEEPISSFVMKSLRRGLQDYEYLWLAKQLGKAAEIQPIVDTIIPAPRKWNKDPNAWYEARMKVAEIILNALKARQEAN